MKIDFKTLTMMELRGSPGEVLDRVARDGDVFIVERNGQAKACLVPVSFLLPDVSPDRITQEINSLNERDEHYKLTINEAKELEVSFHEVIAGESLILTVLLPHGYPDAAPRIYVAPLPADTPNRWQDGSLSIFGTTAYWNSKSHDVLYALKLARGWLKQYATWRKQANRSEGGRSHE